MQAELQRLEHVIPELALLSTQGRIQGGGGQRGHVPPPPDFCGQMPPPQNFEKEGGKEGKRRGKKGKRGEN